jgi:delta(3,5)-delta(2,4)-dienoyl-CoA isomerase
MFSTQPEEGNDAARNSMKIYEGIRALQKQLLVVWDCKLPVLVGVHGKCVGVGVDLIGMCDIRYCTSDA